ncbi:MAG: hypothetical protein WD403_04155 [Pirellulales bacterium]
MKATLQGGPADGIETEREAELIMVALDGTMHPTDGRPAALAVYRETAEGVFEFQGFQSADEGLIPFVDGPMQGERTMPRPGHVRVALDSQMQVMRTLADPAAIAVYERRPNGYSLLRIE